MPKRALITGITGQDGAYLAKLLLSKGYDVFGTYRRLSSPNFWRLQYVNIYDEVSLIPTDLTDSSSIVEAIKISEPDEIYNLAAQSFVGASFEQPIATGNVSGLGVTSILEIVRQILPSAKFYQASSSEMYGSTGNMNGLLNETSEFRPASPYAAAKCYGFWITKMYREAYGLFACGGILFNHESPLRGLDFVTRKITNSVAKITLGLQKELRLGNIDAKRDWGFAPEYVEAMWRMLQQDKPDDFVIATGNSHSVKEFVENAFQIAGLDWQDFVKIDKCYFRPLDVNNLTGDYSKAEKEIGWKPKVAFSELINLMFTEDITRWEDWLKGKKFPWDAPYHNEEMKVISRTLRV